MDGRTTTGFGNENKFAGEMKRQEGQQKNDDDDLDTSNDEDEDDFDYDNATIAENTG